MVSAEHPTVDTEIGIGREKLAGSASWAQLITGKPRIFNRDIAGIVLQSIQQLTGNNYFFYYAVGLILSKLLLFWVLFFPQLFVFTVLKN